MCMLTGRETGKEGWGGGRESGECSVISDRIITESPPPPPSHFSSLINAASAARCTDGDICAEIVSHPGQCQVILTRLSMLVNYREISTSLLYSKQHDKVNLQDRGPNV